MEKCDVCGKVFFSSGSRICVKCMNRLIDGKINKRIKLRGSRD